MKRRYALYAIGLAAVLLLLATTSYGALLLASVLGVTVLASGVITFVALFSVSERVAQRAVRVWKAIIPAHVTSTLFRH
jgi:hypothetical protein